MLKNLLKLFGKNNFLFVAVLLVGTISWSLTMVKSSLVYRYGMGFWGPNGHDGIWHVALAGSLARGSFHMPIFAGEALKNYHLGFDLILAGLNKLTGIRIDTLYFQILPPILAFLVGYLTYKFVYLWKRSIRSSLLATFFVYFGGSFAWLLGKGESAFWSQQAISTLINPPFALSLVFILLGLILLLKKKTLLAVLFFGPLIQIKAYGAILVLGGLLVSRHFKVFLGTLVVALALILVSKSSSFPFVWRPFWFLETMMQLTDRVGWVKFGEAMVNYRAGGVWFKAILAYGAAFAIFIIGNFGTRILAIRYYLSAIRSKFSENDLFVLSVISAGIVIPMFFLQKGTPWNTIQFLYYSLFFSGILAGIEAARVVHSSLFIVIVVLLTIPTTIITLKDVYLPSRPPAMLPTFELEALNFLKGQPQGVVLTYPFDRIKAKEAESFPPRPLYLYESAAYVAAFSKQPVFLEDEVNLDITGYDWRARRIEIEAWYKETDQEKARDFLQKNSIKYVYWLKGQRAYLGEGQLGVTKIFENKEVDIYVVKSDI